MTTMSSPTAMSPTSRRSGPIARRLQDIGRRSVSHALSRLDSGFVHVRDSWEEAAVADACGCCATVDVRDPHFYIAAALGGGLGIAESYMDGEWTCSNLPSLIEVMASNWQSTLALQGPATRLLAPMARAAYWLERNTLAGSRRNIHAHYDLGNGFFSLFLDPTMTYSSAYFEIGNESLEEAQMAKLDRVCRALSLNENDHLLEIGSGWGSLAIHAAMRYGCRVTTTTISQEQHRFASERVRRLGLADRVRVIDQDYRDVKGSYSKIASIEMIEAVGRNNMGVFFRTIAQRLQPDGAALIQAITIRDQMFDAASRRRDFLKKYIFPGSCLPGMRFMIEQIAKHTDFILTRTEDFGDHYARTLALWRRAFLARLPEVRALGFDEPFIRMWDYYLAYCEGSFRARTVGVSQILLTRPAWRAARGA